MPEGKSSPSTAAPGRIRPRSSRCSCSAAASWLSHPCAQPSELPQRRSFAPFRPVAGPAESVEHLPLAGSAPHAVRICLMAAFGSFETEREIYSDPIYTVYSARKPGDSKSEYAIKVFSVHRAGFDEESAKELDPLLSDIERSCVQRIEIQKQAAASSALISPILETGQDER